MLHGQSNVTLAAGGCCIRGSNELIDPSLRHVQLLDGLNDGLIQALLIGADLVSDHTMHKLFLKVRVHRVSDGHALGG